MANPTPLERCVSSHVDPRKVDTVAQHAPGEDVLGRVTALFRLLGDPTRARLLYALLEAGELCVCDLAAATNTSEVTVSQSLRMMRISGVVSGRRAGRNVFYRLSDAHVRLLLDVTREHVLHENASGDTRKALS